MGWGGARARACASLENVKDEGLHYLCEAEKEMN